MINFKKILNKARLLLVIACSALYAQESQELWMVIFTHGTSGAVGNISFSNLYKVMIDEVENTEYEKAVDLIRSNPYTYQHQPIQEYGLHKVDRVNRDSARACGLFAHMYDCMHKETFQKEFDARYYTFGWSGVLSESIRYKNASRFYHELLEEYKQLVLDNPDKKVKICIIGYSHGGTVALQLAHVLERETPEPLTIDLLISLGTPVQKETDHLVASPMFKKVYHIYSRGDKVQPLDFFSFKRFFSYRRFNDDGRFVTPAKVVQIELILKTKRRKYEAHEKHHRYVNRSPGHIELWFFGWAEGMYRHDFPLYPLPTACLIPTLIKAAHDAMPQETDLVIEFYPAKEECVVKKRKYFKKVKVKTIPHHKIIELQELALQEKPVNFNRQDYSTYVNMAINQAYGKVSHKHRNKGCACGS